MKRAALVLAVLSACGPVPVAPLDDAPAPDDAGTAAPHEPPEEGEDDGDEPPPGSDVDEPPPEDLDEEEPGDVDAGSAAGVPEDAGFPEDAGQADDVVVDAGAFVDEEEPPPPPPPPPSEPSEPAEPAEPIDACADEDTTPPLPSDLPAINGDPRFVHVYVNNIENLKTASEQCAGDWTDLIHYMKTIRPSPDLFLVQQVSNQAQLDLLAQRMTDDLPGVYAGIIADADPWNQASPCGPEKAKQTNAIIYRTGRFTPVGDKHVWQSWAFRDGECRRNFQARTRNVLQKFHDVVADKLVSVVSLHWSTAQGTGPDPACAKMNVLEADQKLHRPGFANADLFVMGGDTNEPDRKSDGSWRPWYAQIANGNLRYRDPIHRLCQGQGLQSCLNDNVTTASRIDFLFAQDGDGCRARTRRAHTIKYAEADAAAVEIVGSDTPLNYSDHRAIRTLVYY